MAPQFKINRHAEPLQIPTPTVRMVLFLHPGYPDNENVLLVLPVFDTGGVHHETARVACAILANCHWDGYFSTTRNGPREGGTRRDEILTNPHYYFCIDEGLSSFLSASASFHSPTNRIWPEIDYPAEGAQVLPATSGRALDRDRACRLTCSSLPNEIALVPVVQEEWWRAKLMYLYTAQPETSVDTNCADNATLPRRDVHCLWDHPQFCIVPKQGRWVLHVLSSLATSELQERYHNVETLPLTGVAREFLFARFALANLSDKNLFPVQGDARKFVLLENRAPQFRVFSGKEYSQLFGSKWQRSAQHEGDEGIDDRQNACLAEQWAGRQSVDDPHHLSKEITTGVIPRARITNAVVVSRQRQRRPISGLYDRRIVSGTTPTPFSPASIS
ncbi:hypothetical protein BBP40_002031 [Aspergillus hancockii]|nr:hypothetical protein BBP40_002031 [Aspergillus hancockii]